MRFEKWVSALLLLQLCCFSCGSCGKVLVWPMEYSHWINMKTILDELAQRDHEITVLTSTGSILIDPTNVSLLNFEIYPGPFTKEDFLTISAKMIEEYIYELPSLSPWEYATKMQAIFFEYSKATKQLCESVVLNKKLMKTLKKAKYDVVVSDAFAPCGELIAQVLGIPIVYTLRFTTGNTYEKYCGGLPSPPSYVPVVFTELTDKMTFMERVKNILYFLYFDFWFQNFDVKDWNQFYSDVLGKPGVP
ncbi:UDP-glucuronosyltransferase 2B31-like [Trichosurus vulpecula]|uniref:UDP-glucuronosyltransferase 2B31-like n=1 Tax=Trichosurus vulpecula TaxID=9337 RepID=UPI00186B09EF|nr:UDP-glucuronosyltransferase 2B31-like [Trichosurus vulpecula]